MQKYFFCILLEYCRITRIFPDNISAFFPVLES